MACPPNTKYYPQVSASPNNTCCYKFLQLLMAFFSSNARLFVGHTLRAFICHQMDDPVITCLLRMENLTVRAVELEILYPSSISNLRTYLSIPLSIRSSHVCARIVINEPDTLEVVLNWLLDWVHNVARAKRQPPAERTLHIDVCQSSITTLFVSPTNNMEKFVHNIVEVCDVHSIFII
jgi:hypothetical protein